MEIEFATLCRVHCQTLCDLVEGYICGFLLSLCPPPPPPTPPHPSTLLHASLNCIATSLSSQRCGWPQFESMKYDGMCILLALYEFFALPHSCALLCLALAAELRRPSLHSRSYGDNLTSARKSSIAGCACQPRFRGLWARMGALLRRKTKCAHEAPAQTIND